jgi:ATP-dependent DNA helicase DinG
MIESVFGPCGLLSAKFPGYSPRRGQIQLAEAVCESLKQGGHLVAEGPTGTGKSLAYLVPAIYRAVGTGKKVIVVTANIALQEQLVNKDLPLLADLLDGHLPRKFTFELVKGKNNFACIDALGKLMGEVGMSKTGDRQLDEMIAWAQQTKTGDKSELTFEPSVPNWRRLSVGSDECKGSGCKFYAQCFSEQSKRRALRADVIVTNYHLFFAHLVVRAKMLALADEGVPVEADQVLPPAETIIFDEAHKAADVARDFLGFSITKGQVDWLVNFDHDIARRCKEEAARFFASALAHRQSRSYKARLKRGHPLDGDLLVTHLARVGKFYRDALSTQTYSPDEAAELNMRSKRAYALADNVKAACHLAEEDVVYFLEETKVRGGGASCAIKSKPIEVAPFLERELFGKFRSVILTSATLATASGSNAFSFVRKEVGLKTGKDLVVESPFRWDLNAMLVVPRTVADPQDRERFPSSVGTHVREVVEAARGRTLALFTSYKNMQVAYDYCADAQFQATGDSEKPYALLRQNTAPRTRLVDQFKNDVSSVLFGCESFWAGVDVPGESLSCVVIDRLPFPTPDDPIVDAISEKDDRWFFNYAIPRAVIAVKQGAGRLIRTTSDRGVVVILDQRLMTKGYGRSFVNALPKMRMADEVSDVRSFFDRESEAK